MDNFHNYNTPMIDIDELNSEEVVKTQKKFEVYQKILEKCHYKIKTTSKTPNNLKCCFYNVPKYVFGIPLYDIKSCIMYLVTALVKNGFDVKYTHPNLLFISWQNKTSKSTQLSIENKPAYQPPPQPQIEINPIDKLLMNTKKISTVDEKLSRLLNKGI